LIFAQKYRFIRKNASSRKFLFENKFNIFETDFNLVNE